MLKSRVLIGLFLVLSTVSTTHAVVAPDGPAGLPDLDARVDRGARQAAAVALRRGVDPTLLVAGPVAEPGQLRLAAVTRLEQRLGTRLSVRWDPVTGSPRLLSARRGFLSDADPRPAPVIAREQAVALAPLWNLSSEQAEALTVRRVVPLGGGGAMVWLEQEIAGLPVFHGHLGIGVDDEGRVVLVSGAGVTGAGALASPTPVHGPAEALVGLARAAGVALKSVPQPVAATADATAFRLPEFGNEVTVRQVVIPTAWGPKLGWRTDLHLLDRPAWHEVIVDDRLLQPVHRTNRTKHVDTRGRVFSNHPGVSSHELVSFPDDTDFRVLASPEGWTSSDVTEGNNTVVRDDRAGDDEATLGAQASATPPPPYLAFDFAFTDDPDADLDAAMTNLFYGINVSHDHFHELGFDAASGNFQVDNFGQGGIASDPVLGDAQDGSGTNNANFQTQPDGFMSRMQMFVWDTTGPLLDSSYDLGVIIHEYTHGVSTRLVGGADEVGCLNAWHGGAMGEGWSDFFASSFLEDPVIGAYLSGNDATGIRMFALDDNPASGKDFRDFCTYPNDFAPVFCAVHDNGEIWSGFLWTLRDAFIATYGAEVGVPLVERLVVDGMKFTPCGPTMVDARDGLILADRATNDGIHECLIKTAARQRWLGFSASAAGGGDAEPIADDGAWPECDGNGVVRFTRDGLEAGAATALYSCDDVVTIQVVDGTASGPLTVTLRTDGGDVEDLTLTSSADPAVFVGSLPSRREAVTAGDAVLQVVSGEGLTVEYVDMEAGMVTDTAQVDCVPRLALAGHRIENGACDADALPDWPQLPGLLDRNESADLRIVLANNMPKAVRGEVRVASMTPALLELLPALSGVPIEMGPALGGVPSQAVVTVKAAATSVPVPFDMGQVEITVLAEGFDPWVDVLELMLDL
ncbi:MAG: M36 family metallopeptidase, partial [Acidobacteriota bacterium]